MRLLTALVLTAALGSLLSAQAPPGDAPPVEPPPTALPHPGDSTGVVPPAEFIPAGPPADVPPPQRTLAYSVVIENRSGGVVRVIEPPAQFLLSRPGEDIGMVLRPATQLNTESFHASLWGRAQSVIASAVNAIHIKAYDQTDGGRAAVLTILPHELLTAGLDGLPAPPRDDMLYTDIPGGHGIFGGAWPVLTGNPVSVYRKSQHVYFDDTNNQLEVGDIIIIEVLTPEQWPQGLVIENFESGAVTLTGADGTSTVCATVSKPVSGSGRFAGGVFCQPGGIRATHSGVLDIDLSPLGETGGLQFIPYAHSLSPELTYSQDSPPYGILLGIEMSDLRGQPPLFGGYLYPCSGLEAAKKLPKLAISVKFIPSTAWVPVPPVSGREELVGLSALRIQWLVPEPESPEAPAPPPAEVPAEQPPDYTPVQPPGFRGS